VKKAFCPPKVTKDNPIIEYAEHIILPALGGLRVSREARHGGPLEIGSAAELRKLYGAGKLHPTDLKAAVGVALVQVLEPVRRYFEEHPDAKLARPHEVL